MTITTVLTKKTSPICVSDTPASFFAYTGRSSKPEKPAKMKSAFRPMTDAKARCRRTSRYEPAVPGGCVFLAAAAELDDGAGPQRDFLVTNQAAFVATLSKAARIAVEEGQFRADLDCEQFAFEMLGISLAYHHTRRLLRHPKAEARASAAFEALLRASS